MTKTKLGFRRKHYHTSAKAGTIYCDSSYELRAALLLDENASVVSYKNHISFFNKSGKQRVLDYLVTFADNSRDIIEIKPARRVEEFQEQIDDNKEYAAINGWGFRVWTENELGFSNEREITAWADRYLTNSTSTDYVDIRKKRGVERSKRHYDKAIKNDTILVHCDYCNIPHTALRLTYDKNIARNGRYICEKEGGHIAGSLPKPHLRKENPYAAEGKKQCAGKCQNVLSLDDFGNDKCRPDGKTRVCKKCRAEAATAKYQEKIQKD